MIHQIIRRAFDLPIYHFLLFWFFSLAAIVVAGWWLHSRFGKTSPIDDWRGVTSKVGTSHSGSWDRLAFVGFSLFTALYVFLIYYKEDFSYYDDDILTEFSLQGKNFAPPIWTGVGRFYPLADQEFNLLRFITRSAFGFHTLVVVELLILLVIIFLIVREFQLRYRCLIAVAIMLLPSFLIPFMGFVYPERNVLFGLAILVLCLQGYSRRHSRLSFIGCLVATHFILYYKETAVVFVVTFAASSLLLQSIESRSSSELSWAEVAQQNLLNLGMLTVAGFYIVVFLVVMIPHRHFSYVSGLRQPLSDVLGAYVRFDLLPFLLIAILLFRIGGFLSSRIRPDLLWDPLAVGALAYFAGIVELRINSGYYLAPVDLIALLYMANMARVWVEKASGMRTFAVATVTIALMLQASAYSSFRVVERKEMINLKAQLAEFLENYRPTVQGDSVELFFPYASGYHLMDLASYLHYKRSQLEGQAGSGARTEPTLVFKGPEPFDNNKCVEYREYSCIHAESPSPGALVVVLPDDPVSMNQTQALAKDSKQLLAVHCEVCSKYPEWFRLLHTISAEYSLSPLPGHWLQVHVYQN